MGKMMQFLINEENRTFFGMKLPTGFQLIGQTTLKGYQAWVEYFDRQSKSGNLAISSRITKRAYARVGVNMYISQCMQWSASTIFFYIQNSMPAYHVHTVPKTFK
jgi:hypothetical protein